MLEVDVLKFNNSSALEKFQALVSGKPYEVQLVAQIELGAL